MNAKYGTPILVPDRAALFAVVIGVTCFAVAQGVTYPLVSLVLEKHGVTEALIGLNAAVFAAGLACSTVSVPLLSRTFDGQKLIIAGFVGVSACLFTFAATDMLWLWFAARFLLGFFVNLIFILSEAWLNSACPDRLRGRVAGLYGAGMATGFAIGPTAIPLFGTENGFAFAIIAAYVAAAAFLVALLSGKARTRPDASSTGDLRKFAFAAPVLLLMVMVFSFSDITLISTMPVYLVKLGHTEAFAAISVSVMSFATALAQPAIGYLLDKTSRMLVTAATALVTATAFFLITMTGDELMILLLASIAGGASFGLYTCALTILGERFSGGMLVAGSAAFGLAYALGSAAGSTGTGVAMDIFGPAGAPIGTGLVVLAVVPLFIALQRK